jgi:hypothetical protein
VILILYSKFRGGGRTINVMGPNGIVWYGMVCIEVDGGRLVRGLLESIKLG